MHRKSQKCSCSVHAHSLLIYSPNLITELLWHCSAHQPIGTDVRMTIGKAKAHCWGVFKSSPLGSFVIECRWPELYLLILCVKAKSPNHLLMLTLCSLITTWRKGWFSGAGKLKNKTKQKIKIENWK